MSYCGECYWQGKRLKPCSTCYCGSEANYMPTRADRIRAMSDEELAKVIAEKIECTECPFVGDEEKCGNVGCSDLFLDWLQSEVSI